MRTLTIVLLLCTITLALGASSVPEFRKILWDSRRACIRNRPTRPLRHICPGANTVAKLYARVPGGKTTVRPFAGPPLMRLLDLCEARESDTAADWRHIHRNRALHGSSVIDELWKECSAQMRLEREDCKHAKQLLCSFSHGTAMHCAPASQKRRRARTLDHGKDGGDQCYQFIAFADGRASTAAEFHRKLAVSRRMCLFDKDKIVNKCRQERSVSALLAFVPRGVSVRARAGPEFYRTIERCRELEDFGWTNVRIAISREFIGNPRMHLQCTQQVNNLQFKVCKETQALVCAFTYGTDFACAPRSQKPVLPRNDPCDAVTRALRAQALGGRRRRV